MNTQQRSTLGSIAIVIYFLLLLLPIYWLINMSLKTNDEILSGLTLWPRNPTLDNYREIFTNEAWYSGYINSITYTVINTVMALVIALLLRFMDSFMIYTEPFVITGGGPGTATTFLSIYLTNIAIGQFDLGNGAAFSLIYFLFIQVFCYIFYTIIQNLGRESN